MGSLSVWFERIENAETAPASAHQSACKESAKSPWVRAIAPVCQTVNFERSIASHLLRAGDKLGSASLIVITERSSDLLLAREVLVYRDAARQVQLERSH